jgi:hypothetical protein
MKVYFEPEGPMKSFLRIPACEKAPVTSKLPLKKGLRGVVPPGKATEGPGTLGASLKIICQVPLANGCPEGSWIVPVKLQLSGAAPIKNLS